MSVEGALDERWTGGWKCKWTEKSVDVWRGWFSRNGRCEIGCRRRGERCLWRKGDAEDGWVG